MKAAVIILFGIVSTGLAIRRAKLDKLDALRSQSAETIEDSLVTAGSGGGGGGEMQGSGDHGAGVGGGDGEGRNKAVDAKKDIGELGNSNTESEDAENEWGSTEEVRLRLAVGDAGPVNQSSLIEAGAATEKGFCSSWCVTCENERRIFIERGADMPNPKGVRAGMAGLSVAAAAASTGTAVLASGGLAILPAAMWWIGAVSWGSLSALSPSGSCPWVYPIRLTPEGKPEETLPDIFPYEIAVIRQSWKYTDRDMIEINENNVKAKYPDLVAKAKNGNKKAQEKAQGKLSMKWLKVQQLLRVLESRAMCDGSVLSVGTKDNCPKSKWLNQ